MYTSGGQEVYRQAPTSRSGQILSLLDKISKKKAFCNYFFEREKKESRFYVIIPAFRRLRRADSMYVYHHTLAFEPDFFLEQRSTLNSGCPS